MVMARNLAEKDLRDKETRYRILVDHAIDAIYLSRTDGQLIDVNPEALKQTGYSREEILTKTILDIDVCTTSETLHPFFDQLIQKGWSSFESKHRKKDGTIYPVDIRAASFTVEDELFILGVARDISENKRINELLVQNEKMMSVGGLAAGMAHEINNPLGGILQNIQVILRRLTEQSSINEDAAQKAGCSLQSITDFMHSRNIFEHLESIRESGARAAQVVKTMLEFSRGSDSHKSLESINDLLEATLYLCSNDYNLKKNFDFRNISIQRDFASDLPKVLCSKIQIQQVFMNLFSNSAHAMRNTPSPTLCIKTEHSDGCIRVTVEDNGRGMDETTRRKVFEPFFTTKAVGEGTGLGLSVSYFIITTTHEGSIEVESSLHNGTRFTIALPLH